MEPLPGQGAVGGGRCGPKHPKKKFQKFPISIREVTPGSPSPRKPHIKVGSLANADPLSQQASSGGFGVPWAHAPSRLGWKSGSTAPACAYLAQCTTARGPRARAWAWAAGSAQRATGNGQRVAVHTMARTSAPWHTLARHGTPWHGMAHPGTCTHTHTHDARHTQQQHGATIPPRGRPGPTTARVD